MGWTENVAAPWAPGVAYGLPLLACWPYPSGVPDKDRHCVLPMGPVLIQLKEPVQLNYWRRNGQEV